MFLMIFTTTIVVNFFHMDNFNNCESKKAMGVKEKAAFCVRQRNK